MTNKQLKAFGADLYKVCKKHKATINDSLITFESPVYNEYCFVIWGGWKITPKSDAVEIYEIKTEEVK